MDAVTDMEAVTEESILSESDFDSVESSANLEEPDTWSVPDLPDVATPPDVAGADLDSGDEADPEPADEIASQLEVPPLNLATPDLPNPDESQSATGMDDQDIEDLLTSMMTPVTATATTIEGS
jgi:hypothetical protein